MVLSNNILIDTNVLVYMYENKKDIFEVALNLIPNAKFFVLDLSFDEIDKIFKDKKKRREYLKRYLKKLEEQNKFEIIKTEAQLREKFYNVDSVLVYLSSKYLIYTNDKKLKWKLKNRGKKVLTLRVKGAYVL
ncbi:MAG: PIN domain-containing protein [archaeon]